MDKTLLQKLLDEADNAREIRLVSKGYIAGRFEGVKMVLEQNIKDKAKARKK